MANSKIHYLYNTDETKEDYIRMSLKKFCDEYSCSTTVAIRLMGYKWLRIPPTWHQIDILVQGWKKYVEIGKVFSYTPVQIRAIYKKWLLVVVKVEKPKKKIEWVIRMTTSHPIIPEQISIWINQYEWPALTTIFWRNSLSWEIM